MERCHVSQGFDKYGIGARTALPTPRLQAALGFKVDVHYC